MNHSSDWNSQVIYDESKDYRKMISIAVKPIKAGDEITEYYGNYLST
jgi:SET domain-containing protein